MTMSSCSVLGSSSLHLVNVSLTAALLFDAEPAPSFDWSGPCLPGSFLAAGTQHLQLRQ